LEPLEGKRPVLFRQIFEAVRLLSHLPFWEVEELNNEAHHIPVTFGCGDV